jgi:hypothetical protein
MDKFLPSASDRSRSGTPGNGRFTAQAETAEDLLKSQTVGLVHLDDFRKRRAEALEQKERGGSGASTPADGYVRPQAGTASELICKVQDSDANTLVQKKAQGSYEGQALVRHRCR